MNYLHNKTYKFYKLLVDKLQKDNEQLVNKLIVNKSKDRNNSNKKHGCSFKVKNDRSIFPYITPEPKTNFFIISPMNVYTKDDPILRYVPSIKASSPTSIEWFDGTVVGESPMGCSDTIESISNMLKNNENNKNNNINKNVDKNNIMVDKKIMSDLFCKICCIFDCGIHKIVEDEKTNIIIKFNEKKACICKPKEIKSIKIPKNI